MARLFQYAGQAVFYAIIAAVTGYFASFPVYEQFPDGMAQIKLSFAHGAARQKACRRLTSQEIAKLPPNERRPNNCSRERVAIHLQLRVDDATLLDERLRPTGLAEDGPARVYRKFAVTPGSHKIVARMRDSAGEGDFNYETRREVELSAGQSLAVDFKSDTGGFVFQ